MASEFFEPDDVGVFDTSGVIRDVLGFGTSAVRAFGPQPEPKRAAAPQLTAFPVAVPSSAPTAQPSSTLVITGSQQQSVNIGGVQQTRPPDPVFQVGTATVPYAETGLVPAQGPFGLMVRPRPGSPADVSAGKAGAALSGLLDSLLPGRMTVFFLTAIGVLFLVLLLRRR